ncbi:MAG: hypothetical protein ACLFPW_09155 [Spirochaetaceae bacterium]
MSSKSTELRVVATRTFFPVDAFRQNKFTPIGETERLALGLSGGRWR